MSKPILMNTEMVRAILDGRKTVTRRVVKPQPNGTFDQHWGLFYEDNEWIWLKEPYRSGDILWVRETWKKVCASERYYENGEVVSSDELFGYKYRADNSSRWDIRSPRDDEFFLSEIIESAKWRPSIHMPREAARIFLRVTDVRVEKLQAISYGDLQREGGKSDFYKVKRCRACGYGEPHYPECDYEHCENYKGLWAESFLPPFIKAWDSTVKPADRERYGWAANPWVWVIEFERCEKPAD